MVEEFESLQQFTTRPIPVFLVLILLVGLLVEFLVVRRLQRWMEQKNKRFWTAFFYALRWQALFFSIVMVLTASIMLYVEPKYPDIGKPLLTVLGALVTLDITFVIFTRLLNGWTTLYVSRQNLPSVSIIKNTITAVIAFIAFLLTMYAFGVPVTPWLTVVAGSSIGLTFALRDPLASLFSGVVLVASNRVHPGDYVRLSTGEEGYITDIQWHTTTVRQLQNNLVVVPNSTMVNATIINYDHPEKELSILVDLGVSYDSDLRHVERVTIEVADEVMQEIAGGVKTSSSFIRYNTFADFSINFTVIMRGETFVDQYLIKHEFVMRLHERYKKEGIVIPFPIRTLETNPHHPLEIAYTAGSNGQQLLETKPSESSSD